MCIWLHSIHSIGTRKLLFAPDTDVLYIGMTLLSHARLAECDIIIRMHSFGAKQKKYIRLSQMPTCLKNGPDLAGFTTENLLQILKTLYVVTGLIMYHF